MNPIASCALRVITGIALASALGDAALAEQSNYFLKLGGVEGESQDDKHKNQIEILSWSWSETQTADALTDGLIIMRNTDEPAESAAKVNKVDAISIKQSVQRDDVGERRDYVDGSGQDSATAIGNTKWKNIVLKRGTDTAASGGVSVAAGDVTGDGRNGKKLPLIDIDHEVASPRDTASGQATGKRQHKPVRIRIYDSPLERGSVVLRLAQPWPDCKAGDRFNGAYLATGTTHTYQLDGAEVIRCADNDVILNYAKAVRQPPE